MKSKYTAPKVLCYGSVDTLTQYIGKSPTDDSFSLNGNSVEADGSCGFLNNGSC
ncbi:lasso peptide [Altericista sp. CCNU0014]|uniref:lasso peptide n=1 Tax=Altericista sp. CCNU0014 TaxID=3082949 RepID=UPI00384B6563